MKKKLPNLLTLFRIFLVLLILTFAILSRADFTADWWNQTQIDILIFTFFVTASFTDFLDGYLARKWQVISNFGKLWDPLADKLLVTTTLLIYLAWGRIPLWVVVLFIGRDLLVDGLRMLALEKQVVIAASIWGKIKTVAQMVALSFLILNLFSDFHVPFLLLLFALAASLWSMVIYYYHFFTLKEDSDVKTLVNLMRAKGQTIACAESLTGGLIAHQISTIPGASNVLVGGVVAYQAAGKIALLGLDPNLINTSGTISAATALAMVKAVKDQSGASYAVAVTGNAGPTAVEGKAVGDVFIAILHPAGQSVKQYHFKGSRQVIQLRVAQQVIQLILNLIKEDHYESN